MDIFHSEGDATGFRLDRGWPASTLQATSSIQAALAAHVQSDAFHHALFYGEPAGGYLERTTLAHALSDCRSLPLDPDALVFTAGSGAALDLLLAQHRAHSNVVFTEKFSYHNALTMMRDHEYTIKPLPDDGLGGLQFDAVDAAFATQPGALCYLVPSFSNPRGTTMVAEERRLLVELAGKHRVRIIADEVYSLLAFEDEVPPSFASFDPSGRVAVTLGSFTKIAGPGLRLGWMEFGASGAGEVDETWRASVLSRGVLVNGGCLNQLSAWSVGKWIEDGHFLEHLRRLRGRLRQRAHALWKPLSEGLNPDRYRFMKPMGGYFLWLHSLRPGFDLVHRLASAGVIAKTSSDFMSASSETPGTSGVRLSFSWLSEEEIAEAASIIVRVLS